ncbi:hypothetical protein M2272_004977 [Mycobacterium frederiksbergense]|uniref:Uncharacterized protein n=1 Tax=Mycolicibacterium frederiksbergense TaxID=117567 RepID=A0ABT6L5Z3_9MYCO|nr:hypothetical protein [Mycolicibacterium frederiksbergense]MDH6198318.1 hypothetical protein [Mycolicibacterium frederiksbergense]
MTDLLADVLEAHGGVQHWKEHGRVEATIVTGGGLWALKGQPQDAQPRQMAVTLHRQWASVRPFGAPDQKTDFTADRVAIEKLDGRVVAELAHPRASFAGHKLETPWNPLQRAYFNGYALWTYLTTPFLMTLPGFTAEEIAPVEHKGETWRGLRVGFPPHIASHSAVQEFYFDSDNLIRRHDYRVDVAGGLATADVVVDQ